MGWGKAKGRSRVGWVTATLIVADAPSTEDVAKLSVVCPPHRGCHAHTTRGAAQPRVGAKRRAAPQGWEKIWRGLDHKVYTGGDGQNGVHKHIGNHADRPGGRYHYRRADALRRPRMDQVRGGVGHVRRDPIGNLLVRVGRGQQTGWPGAFLGVWGGAKRRPHQGGVHKSRPRAL